VIRVGTAGWSIPRAAASGFAVEGTHLARYSRTLSAVEINSSFYRPHARKIYERWAAQVPAHFKFAVKLPRTITHDRRLTDAQEFIETFLSQVAGLGSKLGVLLVQLPPSLALDMHVAGVFFGLLRERYSGAIACEPRHLSWFASGADALLRAHRISRVAADPSITSDAATPGGWVAASEHEADAVAYYRLHGSPRMYWSRYSTERLAQWSEQMRAMSRHWSVWCIFDNTASGAAAENALTLNADVAGSVGTGGG
jgi:uncharacterized protein YecE (DUF72 family)